MNTSTRTGSAADCPAWAALAAAAVPLRAASLQSLFDADAARSARCTADALGLRYDFSRQRVDATVLRLFADLAGQLQLRERIAAMFGGAVINTTERRAVLHTALRRSGAPGEAVQVDGVDVMPQVLRERARVLEFAEAVRGGAIRGSSGLPFRLVVNIGIGGSDLGPAMAVEALRAFTAGAPRIAFVANVDGSQLVDALADADPARTLFIICSKTFTTQETRANALAARDWLRERLGAVAVPAHFAAVSVNAPAMDEFGVHPDYRFAMWDWVGGRYSVWSSIGVALAIAIGADGFSEFLAGARAMDEHFQTAPWERNLPVLAGMLGVWNRDFLQLPTLAVLPYDQRLARFPAYLQQLEMESNGKSVRLDGQPVTVPTCPVVWGEPGSMAQHSFFQLLRQGSPLAALDFLLPAQSSCGRPDQQLLAIANCLAQAEAFAYGQSAERVTAELRAAGADAARIAELLPHKVHAGNRPSTLILFPRLDPHTLGALIALYEHKVFVQSVVWGINAFDQWGVELGKKLCEGILPLVRDPARAEQGGQPVSASLRAALAWLAQSAQ
jgi:glucose-6-phosphate isomerase